MRISEILHPKRFVAVNALPRDPKPLSVVEIERGFAYD